MKKCIQMSFALFFAFTVSLYAGDWDKAFLRGTTDKDRALYAPNETMTFTLKVDGIPRVPDGKYFIQWYRDGDDGQKKNGKVPVSLTEPLVIKTSLDRPGFVRVQAYVVDEKGKRVLKENQEHDRNVFFDGGAGVKIDQLKGAPEPEDFDAFWKKQKARLDAVPIRADKKECPSENKNVKIYAIQIDCAGPRPVTGYLTVPNAASAKNKMPCRAEFHGYGTHVQRAPQWGRNDCIVLNINAHGYDLGKDEEYYKKFFESIKSRGKSYAFDAVQNKNPEEAYFNGMALRVMRALQYLKSLPEWNGKDLIVSGGSQGGLQSMWAIGLDQQVSKAYPVVPWCCDLAGLTLGRMTAGWRIPYIPEIKYYDPIYHARRINKNAYVEIVRAGLGDYCCPPSGVSVLYNNIPCPKKINWVQGSTHGFVPPKPYQSFTIESK